MSRHYLRILPALQSYVLDVAPESINWMQDLFDDVTEGGFLRYVELAPNERGARIGLCGDNFFCEAGKDALRGDTLFVFRVEPAERRLPTRIPKKYEAKFVPIFGKHEVKPGDPVDALFGEPTRHSAPPRPSVKPSGKLLDALAGLKAERRERWRPMRNRPGMVHDPKAFLGLVRTPWLQHRLGAIVTASKRERMILDKQITPASLSENQRGSLLAMFGIDTLNAVAHDDERFVSAVLESMEPLPLPEVVVADIWAACSGALTPNEFRHEIHACSTAFARAHGSDLEGVWEEAVLGAIRNIIERHNDRRLDALLEDLVTSDAGVLSGMAVWSKSLEFGDDAVDVETANPAIDPEPLEEPPPSADVATDVPTNVLDQWVLALRLPDPGALDELTQGLRAATSSCSSALEELNTVDRLASAVAVVRETADRGLAWCEGLPSAEELEEAQREALSAWRQGVVSFGPAFTDELRHVLNGDKKRLLTPRDVLELAPIAEMMPVLEALPVEVWTVPDGGGQGWLQRLTVNRNRTLARTVLDRLADLDVKTAIGIASTLTPAPDGVDVIEHIANATRQALASREFLAGVPELARPFFARAVAEGRLPSELEHASDAVRVMSEELSSELLAAVLQRLAEAESFDTVFKYERAVHFVIENFGSSDVATIQMLDKRVDLDVGAPDSRVTEDGTPAVLEFDHNRIDEEGSRAPLTFRTLSGRVYGEVVAPIVISTRQRRDYDLKLEIAMKTKLRDAWPSDWPNAEPGSIHVRHSDWRVHPEREGTYVFTFSLVVPTRQPKANDKISATLWAVDASTGAALSVQKSLSWDDVRAESAALTVDWPSSLRAQVVTEHPLGPQLHRDRIESRMENLASFAVVAPRRYGKSTLAAYLCDYLQQRDVAVVGDLLCTRHQERSGLNYEQLWASVSETLEAVVGATLAKERDGLLPAPKAFDRVRIAAKRSGKRAIALIVDEAQLLFDHRDGYMLGDRLKDALEREWSQATDEKVPVFLGLVGLPSLVQRGGANLMGLLSPFEHYELREADVQKLILKVTRNALHSTREARMRLANVSDNLYVLRKLLDGLAFRLADQGRCWAGYDDVVAVERELYQRLRAGAGEESLRKYVRDALNDADSVNEWRPAASYPLAVALARAKAQGHQRRARLKTACQLLNDWALSLAGDDRERLVFVEDALDDHLRVLADRGVYVSDDFRSQWSEAWLQGESSQGWPDDAGARRALVSSALTRIRVPRPLEPVGEGAQASVFLYEGENERLAVRKVPLATERQRRDFLESVQMLSTIRQPAIRRERGADCIFDLLNIGVMDDDDSHGVQIYRWVDGEDLGTKHHALPATLVVELGHQLALALQLLHANGILHRDIRPANIVVEDGHARPVLIDFGLARMSGSEMHTQVAHEFGAPEVQIPDPKWSPAADVFSLAVTLAWLCSPVDDLTKQVNDALWSSRSQEPGKRPSAAELARFLADLRKEMDVERRKTDARARLEAAVSADDRDKQWFRRVYDRFEPIFTAIILGLHGDVLDRASHAADFINQTLEACPSDGRYGQQLSLGQLKAVRSHEGVKISKTDFELMWALRTKRSHGSNKWSRSKIMRRFDSPAPQRIRDMALHVARATSEIIGVTSVLELVEIIVADGPN